MRLFGVDALHVVHLINHPNSKKDPFDGEGLGFLQVDQGQGLVTSWPHDNVHAFGLACNAASQFAVVSSRYGLYTADISNASTRHHVEFQAAPPCRDIEGDPLQDVSLMCGSEGADCQIAVLHQQGRRLSRCDLQKPVDSRVHAKFPSLKTSAAMVTDDWLNDGGRAVENVQSLALTSACSADNAQACAYVGTTGGRLVMMQQTAGKRSTRKWFPHQLVRQGLNGTESGAMDIIHGRYLGLLHRDGARMDVLDLEKEGALVDSWHFPSPSKHHAWNAMCAAGDNLYLLSAGPSPQLWRFPVPAKLKATAAAKLPPTAKLPQKHAPAVAQPTLLSSSAHHTRKHAVSHVSLGLHSDGSVDPQPRPALRR